MAPSGLPNVLIVGAGGVGGVAAHKAAQNNDRLGEVTIASRGLDKAEAIRRAILDKGNLKNPDGRLEAVRLDAKDVAVTAALIRERGIGIVVNCASSTTNLPIMEACLEAGAHYLDTSVYEKEGEENAPPPWYANYEWPLAPRFAERGLTALLSIGFDPGVVNVFCAKAARDLVEEIDTIDIMDVNAGDHGRYFATNFDPEINLREIKEDVVFWEEGRWRRIPPHSRSRTYDFPEVGEQRVYSVGHDELHSLWKHIPARRIEFWMGFGERYLQVFAVLNKLGLLSSVPVEVEGRKIAPIKVVKALLPDPASLAEGYTGGVCIGCQVRGRHEGKPRQVFIYSTCEHEHCFRDVGSQAISYTTGVPAISAALALAEGPWNVGRMVNVEELDPAPFLEIMPRLGIGWHIREETPDSFEISEHETVWKR